MVVSKKETTTQHGLIIEKNATTANRRKSMNLPYSEQLDIGHFGRFFDNTSECYKFFWFKAILSKISEGKTEYTYEELVDEMIAEAWYMVSEYHLNLGPRDNLEQTVKRMNEITNLKSAEKKSNILEYLKNCEDKEIKQKKNILISNVPYRLQAPLMPQFKSVDFEGKIDLRIQKINSQKRLMYYIGEFERLNTKIYVQEDWVEYLRSNLEIIAGWVNFNMINYLQRRNPSVPGIADKIYPPRERNLAKVKKYWQTIAEVKPIHEIYGEKMIERDISIDHFVPWSYVAHDELWNLHPTTRSINSSKGNNLPDWDIYFPRLAKQEYMAYETVWKYEAVHKEFEKCAKEHVNNSDVEYSLYRKGLGFRDFQSELEKIISPIYQSAQNCGFGNWVYKDER